jgi:hypothetical protein
MLSRKVITPIAITLLSAAIFMSCSDGKKDESGKEEIVDLPDTVKAAVLNISGELFSVPSPIQTALLIQKIGIPYDKSTISSHSKVNTFSTDFLRSLNLGVYGADLGYVSLYNQTQDALGLLGAVKQLADKLGVSAAFDAATIQRLKNNMTNKDSMMVLVGVAYRGSDNYLKENQRYDESSLILAGGWIESMHFSVTAYKYKPNTELKYRIAEQKLALNSLTKILSTNPAKDVQNLSAHLNELSKIYEGVSFKYNFAEPKTDTLRKTTTINSTTEVFITDEQVIRISEKIKEIRNYITNPAQS